MIALDHLQFTTLKLVFSKIALMVQMKVNEESKHYVFKPGYSSKGQLVAAQGYIDLSLHAIKKCKDVGLPRSERVKFLARYDLYKRQQEEFVEQKRSFQAYRPAAKVICRHFQNCHRLHENIMESLGSYDSSGSPIIVQQTIAKNVTPMPSLGQSYMEARTSKGRLDAAQYYLNLIIPTLVKYKEDQINFPRSERHTCLGRFDLYKEDQKRFSSEKRLLESCRPAPESIVRHFENCRDLYQSIQIPTETPPAQPLSDSPVSQLTNHSPTLVPQTVTKNVPPMPSLGQSYMEARTSKGRLDAAHYYLNLIIPTLVQRKEDGIGLPRPERHKCLELFDLYKEDQERFSSEKRLLESCRSAPESIVLHFENCRDLYQSIQIPSEAPPAPPLSASPDDSVPQTVTKNVLPMPSLGQSYMEARTSKGRLDAAQYYLNLIIPTLVKRKEDGISLPRPERHKCLERFDLYKEDQERFSSEKRLLESCRSAPESVVLHFENCRDLYQSIQIVPETTPAKLLPGSPDGSVPQTTTKNVLSMPTLGQSYVEARTFKGRLDAAQYYLDLVIPTLVKYKDDHIDFPRPERHKCLELFDLYKEDQQRFTAEKHLLENCRPAPENIVRHFENCRDLYQSIQILGAKLSAPKSPGSPHGSASQSTTKNVPYTPSRNQSRGPSSVAGSTSTSLPPYSPSRADIVLGNNSNPSLSSQTQNRRPSSVAGSTSTSLPPYSPSRANIVLGNDSNPRLSSPNQSRRPSSVAGSTSTRATIVIGSNANPGSSSQNQSRKPSSVAGSTSTRATIVLGSNSNPGSSSQNQSRRPPSVAGSTSTSLPPYSPPRVNIASGNSSNPRLSSGGQRLSTMNQNGWKLPLDNPHANSPSANPNPAYQQPVGPPHASPTGSQASPHTSTSTEASASDVIMSNKPPTLSSYTKDGITYNVRRYKQAVISMGGCPMEMPTVNVGGHYNTGAVKQFNVNAQ